MLCDDILVVYMVTLTIDNFVDLVAALVDTGLSFVIVMIDS